VLEDLATNEASLIGLYFSAKRLGLGATGIVLLIVSILALRRHGTTVRPDAGAAALVTSGPYRRLRNPIYLADCLILLGLAELTKNVWFVAAAAAFAVLVTRLAILPEERHLKAPSRRLPHHKAKTRRRLQRERDTTITREGTRLIDGLEETGRDLKGWMAAIPPRASPSQ
jgi:protein-S-isoprenylcysteine O-methyltransferase Ste14